MKTKVRGRGRCLVVVDHVMLSEMEHHICETSKLHGSQAIHAQGDQPHFENHLPTFAFDVELPRKRMDDARYC